MCGIVGYIGRRSASEILLNGLRRLEYRGYDSAGVALLADGMLTVVKQTGKVAALERCLAGQVPAVKREAARAGIAHTRWATHGLPTEANAHPHLADGGPLALVHNGIIENYASLRRQLEARGCVFVSQTDTEVLAHLIATFESGDLLAAVSQALKRVEGTYGIAVVSTRAPDRLVVARKGSPLVIGIGDGETIVASDVSAIVAHTRQVIYLQDGDVAQVTAEGPQVFTLDNVSVDRAVASVEWEIGVASTKAFTAQVTVLLMMALKLGRCRRLSRETGLALCEEIAAIPSLIERVLAQSDAIAAVAKVYAKADNAFFIGRGILYPTALEGALKLKEISYIHAEGYQAAELKHGPIALLDDRLPVVALLNDIPGKEKTLGNVQECRARRAPVIGLVTEGDDEAVQAVDHAIRLPRTSASTAPVVTAVALQLFAYHVARERGCEIDQPRNLAKSVTVE